MGPNLTSCTACVSRSQTWNLSATFNETNAVGCFSPPEPLSQLELALARAMWLPKALFFAGNTGVMKLGVAVFGVPIACSFTEIAHMTVHGIHNDKSYSAILRTVRQIGIPDPNLPKSKDSITLYAKPITGVPCLP